MSHHLPVILFLLPFLSAVSMPAVALWRPGACRPLAIGTLSTMVLVSGIALIQIISDGPISYPFGGWNRPIGIEWVLDGLAAIVLVPLSIMTLLATLYAGPGIEASLPEKAPHFYTLVLLLVSALTGIVMSADLFNLFVFLEVASLCGYALVAVGGGRALISAFRYLMLGTIGASFYLLGIGYLYATTGTLNMADLARQLPGLLQSTAVLLGLVFIFIGLGIKIALVPLHGWLPDAYADAPDPVSPLIASVMTKVSLYALIRITFWVVGVEAVWKEIPFMVYVGWVGAIATLTGAFLALSEKNIKKIFAYGGISHIGLIVMGVSLGNPTGFAGGIFYLVNDTVMQAALFFVAGTLAYHHGIREFKDLARITKPMPWTSGALIVTALSMIGIPPTGGFFGKWFILLGALEAKNYIAVGAIILGTVLTLAYFIKILEIFFLTQAESGTDPGLPEPLASPALEGPWQMRLGLGISAVCILLFGFFSDPVIALLKQLALPPGL